VRGRVERFVEPSLLLLLREGARHGYELRDKIAAVAGGEGADVGNLYRVLRSLEGDGIVASTWDALSGGPARRMYTLTPLGTNLLDQWVGELRRIQSMIDTFLDRYDTAPASSTSGGCEPAKGHLPPEARRKRHA
jgi:PadR family transcriptional regulator PadR